jgi:hypothetical protein
LEGEASIPDMIVSILCTLGLLFLIFIMAFTEWIMSLRWGKAMTLLPARGGRRQPRRDQLAFVLVTLSRFGLLSYMSLIPLTATLHPGA